MNPASVTRPHILFLNRSYWPDTEATGQLLTELTIDLTQWFDVTVIAGSPNHADPTAQAHQPPEDRSIAVHRVWHTRFSKHSSLGRLINLTTFTLAAWRAACRLHRKPDVIVVQTDPFFLPIVGKALQRRFGQCPLVCYLQDLYPDIAIAVGKISEGWLTRAIRNVLFGIYRKCQKVIVLSSDMRRRCEECGLQPSALEVISNWADTQDVRPIKLNNEFRRHYGLENRFVVMYSGNMGLAHDLDTLLDAAVLIRDRSDLEWVFVGDGARRPALERRIEQQGLSHVHIIPYQPRSFLAHSLSAADVHLVSVLPGVSTCVMPSKLYGILASGTPAVAVAEPETELAELINDHQVGFVCPPGDAECLARRIEDLADNSALRLQMGRNARQLAETEFSRSRQSGRIADLICRVLKRKTPEAILKLLQTGIENLASSISGDQLPGHSCSFEPVLQERD